MRGADPGHLHSVSLVAVACDLSDSDRARGGHWHGATVSWVVRGVEPAVDDQPPRWSGGPGESKDAHAESERRC
jgi:hypothetical protein